MNNQNNKGEYKDKNVYLVKIKDNEGERYINAFSWEYAVYEIKRREQEQKKIEQDMEETLKTMYKFKI